MWPVTTQNSSRTKVTIHSSSHENVPHLISISELSIVDITEVKLKCNLSQIVIMTCLQLNAPYLGLYIIDFKRYDIYHDAQSWSDIRYVSTIHFVWF